MFWWRDGYDWRTEQRPNLTITANRLDADAPLVEHAGATNAYHESFGSAMLSGIAIPTPGCWEITGTYEGTTTLGIVVQVTSAVSL